LELRRGPAFSRRRPTATARPRTYALPSVQQSKDTMRNRRTTSPSRAKRGDQPTSSVPARSDIGENSASELIEAPRTAGFNPLDPHDFADGGGSGGAEAFSRSHTQRGKKP
jgi:hypothetical protein